MPACTLAILLRPASPGVTTQPVPAKRSPGVAREYFIYIMASPTRNTYVGVTNNLERRVWEHKTHATPGYSSKIGATKLAHVETYPDIRDAIAREKDPKDWRCEKKIAPIESQNPFWKDLSREWHGESS